MFKITSIGKIFKVFKGFQKSLVLGFCAEESLIPEVLVSKLFSLTIFELQF